MILRPGGVTLEQLQRYVPDIAVFAKEASTEARAHMEASPSTPGMKYRHYSPKAQVLLLVGANLARMRRAVEEKFVCFCSCKVSIPCVDLLGRFILFCR